MPTIFKGHDKVIHLLLIKKKRQEDMSLGHYSLFMLSNLHVLIVKHKIWFNSNLKYIFESQSHHNKNVNLVSIFNMWPQFVI